jgi:hypothetical protein
MSRKQNTIRELRIQLDAALAVASEIEMRATGTPPILSFEQQVIAAALGLDNGDPLRDYLTDEDVEQCIKTLADVYTVTGVQMPEDWV